MEFSVKKKVLVNGLTLLTIPMETASVAASLLVRVGSRDEARDINGLSHFLEHMVFKGTAKWPRAQEVNKVIDSVGGIFNAFTSQEHTGFWVKLAKKHLALALEFLYQIIFQLKLPPAELERERGVILDEIKMRHDEPMVLVMDKFISQVYGLTQLGQEIIGRSENIRQLKRQQFFEHLGNWYQPGNMVLAVAGAVDSKALTAAAEKIFPVSGGKKQLPQSLRFKQNKPQLQLLNKKIEQAHFCLGMRTFSRTDPRRYTLAVLRTILGGNTSSRLWNEIREKRGLAYYVRTSNDAYWETGYLVTQAGCARQKLTEVLKLTLDQYSQISQKQVQAKELNLAKEYLKGRLALFLEDSQDVSLEFGENLLLEGRIRSIREMRQGIDKVTLADILAVAKEIFVPSQLNLTVVGQVKDNRLRRLL